MQIGSVLPGSAPRIRDNKTASSPRWGKAARTGGQRASFTASRFHPGNRKILPGNQWDWIIGFLKIIIKMRKLSGVTWASWLKNHESQTHWKKPQMQNSPICRFTDLKTEASRDQVACRGFQKPGSVLVTLSFAFHHPDAPRAQKGINPSAGPQLGGMGPASDGSHLWVPQSTHFKKLMYVFIYLTVSSLSSGTWDFCCVMRDISMWHVDCLAAAQAPEVGAWGLSSCNPRALERRFSNWGPRA